MNLPVSAATEIRPAPVKIPVSTLRTLLLSLFKKCWERPSISAGVVSKKDHNKLIYIRSKANRGAIINPRDIPVHLAQTGN
jgi:hypothetical protein